MDLCKKYNLEEISKLKKTSGVGFDDFGPGCTIRVLYKVVEVATSGAIVSERTQKCEGLCLSKRRSGLSSSFIVRFLSGSAYIEMVFSYYSRNIESVEVIKRGKVRRSKIYYIRDRVGRAARVKSIHGD